MHRHAEQSSESHDNADAEMFHRRALSENEKMTGPVDFGDPSDDLYDQIAKLEVDVHELKFEANFYRAAVLISFAIMIERVWERLF